jgi:iron complex outermembrane recepter protein
MSNSMNMPRRNIRRKLMTTASALALGASVYGIGQAQAADAENPLIWIELGGQAEQVRGFGDPVDPLFTPEIISDGFMSPLKAQRALGESFGEEGAISFQPEDSSWIFSASIRYGRAAGGTSKHQQTPGGPRKACIVSCGYLTPRTVEYSETRVGNSETHAVLDFQAGQDVGLGLFGGQGQSTLSVGVRIAQFHSKQTLGMNADPDFYFPIAKYAIHHQTYSVTSHIERSFHGVGPSIAWNASAPFAGNQQDGELTIDWGVNAALLFGRQKVHGHHQTSGVYYKTRFFKYTRLPVSNIHRSGNPDRARAVTVPDLGGVIGLSLRYSDAKISLGYRYDVLLKAMDTGVDTRKTSNLTFNGPYASISVGLGD